MLELPGGLGDLVYVTYRFLTMDVWPAHVHRHRGLSLFVLDPRATRLQILTRLVDLWTPLEQLALRRAWDQPDTGPLADWLLAPEPAVLYVPPAVRLQGESALQGGQELRARDRAGTLCHEHEAVKAERALRLLRSTDYCLTIPYLSKLDPSEV